MAMFQAHRQSICLCAFFIYLKRIVKLMGDVEDDGMQMLIRAPPQQLFEDKINIVIEKRREINWRKHQISVISIMVMSTL